LEGFWKGFVKNSSDLKGNGRVWKGWKGFNKSNQIFLKKKYFFKKNKYYELLD